MDLTELAHWRYRLKALPAEIDAVNGEISWAQRLSHLPNAQYLVREIEKGLGKLDHLKWLLEEAKYKVELGELQLQR